MAERKFVPHCRPNFSRYSVLLSLFFYLTVIDFGTTSPVLVKQSEPKNNDIFPQQYSGEITMPRQALNRAMKYLLLRHFFLKDSDNHDTALHHADESDLTETFQVKAKNLHGLQNRIPGPKSEFDEQLARPDRNYYGWLDFRRRSQDQDDYIY